MIEWKQEEGAEVEGYIFRMVEYGEEGVATKVIYKKYYLKRKS